MRATATAHPNIALIKYWGKRDAETNLPAVGSLSVTLQALTTRTTVEFDAGLEQDQLLLNGREQPAEQGRLESCMNAIRTAAGIDTFASITSENDFPTAAGLASSASGYAALVTAAAAASGLKEPAAGLAGIARIGSGSAPRSLFGGYVLLQNEGDDTRCEQLATAADWPMSIVVAVTTEMQKATTSRVGMEQSRLTSPYYDQWIASHPTDLDFAVGHVADRNFMALAELAEHNCQKMHAVMMTTRPPLLYWSPATLACVHRVTEMRRQGLPVFYTIDAGPQVKAICLPEAAAQVADELERTPGVLRVIVGALGGGASLDNDPVTGQVESG
jgi:diphosphomevalonate decarboxylase